MTRWTDEATVVRPAGRDPFGDPLPGPAGRTTLRGCFAPGSTSEDVLARGATEYANASFYVRGTVPDVRRTDRLEVGGRTWEVDGDPLPWCSPASRRTAGVEIRLRAVRG